MISDEQIKERNRKQAEWGCFLNDGQRCHKVLAEVLFRLRPQREGGVEMDRAMLAKQLGYGIYQVGTNLEVRRRDGRLVSIGTEAQTQTFLEKMKKMSEMQVVDLATACQRALANPGTAIQA